MACGNVCTYLPIRISLAFLGRHGEWPTSGCGYLTECQSELFDSSCIHRSHTHFPCIAFFRGWYWLSPRTNAAFYGIATVCMSEMFYHLPESILCGVVLWCDVLSYTLYTMLLMFIFWIDRIVPASDRVETQQPIAISTLYSTCAINYFITLDSVSAPMYGKR